MQADTAMFIAVLLIVIAAAFWVWHLLNPAMPVMMMALGMTAMATVASINALILYFS